MLFSQYRLLSLLALSICLQASPLIAEVISIPIGQQHANSQSIAKPSRGQKIADVLQQFGEPVQRYATRGTPPITRWEYPSYFVYFEHDHVIHSVVKHRPAVEIDE